MAHYLPLRLALAGLATVLVVGCEQSPQSPSTASAVPPANRADPAPTGSAAASFTAAGANGHTISIMDACDSDSFNAALGADTCTRNGGVRFDDFIKLLTAHHSVGAWHFTPAQAHLAVGDVLQALNRGGETHTFTEVEEFGGGIVPQLNELSGNTTVAPECVAMKADAMIPPGGHSEAETENEEGVEKYQCCIHPWMRLELHVSKH
jgi:plastocyanin